MEDILKIINTIRIKTAEYQDEISNKFNLDAQKQPAGAFGMINNFTILTLELVDYYYSIWSGKRIIPILQLSDRPSTIEQSRQENAERVMGISKSLYIQTLSSIEFSAKQTLKDYLKHPLSNQIRTKKGRIYLRYIIIQSETLGLLSNEALNEWLGLIEMRNIIVHNNGIADCEAEYTIGNEHVIMKKDQMTQGTLKFFPNITLTAVEKYRKWIMEFFKEK